VAASSLMLKQGLHTYEAEAAMPAAAAQQTIYSDPASDNLIQVMVQANFAGLSSELTLRKFELLAADAKGGTLNPAMIIDGKKYSHAGVTTSGQPVRFEIPPPTAARSVYECRADGNRRVTWLVRHQALDWQVRNATVADHGKYLEIGPLRNPWTHRREVVIAPMGEVKEHYVHRLQNTEKVRVYPLNRNNDVLKIEVLECHPGARITVHCQKAPTQVLGAKDWQYSAPNLSISVAAGDKIQVSL
jgi:hypothetical protein